VSQNNAVAKVLGVLIRGWWAGPALGGHRHSGADPRNSHRARRVAPACEVVSEDHITRSKTARGAVADPDFHLPRENKNVLTPGRGVPIAPMVRGLLRAIADDKTCGILAAHASTGMRA
jgi:hypothetical protein